ncbi:MAG: glycoside hydrolase family 9 protein, partial [Bacteroidia bacterium]|nr:glycoside hydrolase family 9 protein [Bacteroidia bacterium]
GQSTTPLVQAGIMGHYLFRNDPIKSANYLGAIYSTADYFLGNNPLNMVWITGVGERSPAEIFNLDSWYIGGDSPRKGIVPYGPWEGANDYGPLGPWNHLWPYNFTHPSNKDLWPGHERWFDQRTSPLAAEYTVDQNLGPAIFTYGYLFAQTAQDFPLAISPEQSSSLAIKVYPNPSKGAVTIELPGEIRPTSILVYGMDGRLLVEQAWQSGELSLHQLTPGIYFIGIRDESGTYGFQKLRLEGE